MKHLAHTTTWGAWRATALLAAGALAASLALAAGGGGGGAGLGAGGDGSPEYTKAMEAIEGEHWAEAIALLEPYVQRARNDADGHNWLAYAYRKSGRLEPAFVHYKRALQIAPTHLGAHEYLGEAYLQAGQPDKAEYHLRELARLCDARCEPYGDLKQAIASYRAKVAVTPGS